VQLQRRADFDCTFRLAYSRFDTDSKKNTGELWRVITKVPKPEINPDGASWEFPSSRIDPPWSELGISQLAPQCPVRAEHFPVRATSPRGANWEIPISHRGAHFAFLTPPPPLTAPALPSHPHPHTPRRIRPCPCPSLSSHHRPGPSLPPPHRCDILQIRLVMCCDISIVRAVFDLTRASSTVTFVFFCSHTAQIKNTILRRHSLPIHPPRYATHPRSLPTYTHTSDCRSPHLRQVCVARRACQH
jgi:hypothetical protein